jgi:hypothetical protein
LILHAVEIIKNEDSKNIITALDESRDMLRNSLEEFKREQNEYRKQLEDIARYKDAAMQRRKGKKRQDFDRIQNDLFLFFVKKMPFHFRYLCDKNVMFKVLLIFMKILV